MALYYRNAGAASGLCLLPKVKYEHVYLSSRSKMRVDLAAQVTMIQQYHSGMMLITHAGYEWKCGTCSCSDWWQ